MAEPRVIFRGKKIDLGLKSVTLADGSQSEREVILHPGAVALVPMVDVDHVCLVRVRRHAIDKVCLEVPAGTIDPAESPDTTAARELREETGYTAGQVRRVAEWWPSPALFTERMHLYLCTDLRPGPTDLQPDEQIEPVIVAWAEALRMVYDGEIEDAKSMLALMICDRGRRE